MSINITHNNEDETATVEFAAPGRKPWKRTVDEQSDEYQTLLDAIDSIWSLKRGRR